LLAIDDLVGGVVGGVLGGATWGVGFVAATGAVLVAAPRAKPLAKLALKGYFAATHRAREMAAEASEQIQDLYAEAKYEHESQLVEGTSANGEATHTRRRRSATAGEQTA
jgi:Protein of unknown function (DUF5132)